MEDQIEHIGVIKKIDGRKASVVVEQSSACSECHAKSMCTASEKSEKIIETHIIDDGKFYEGERVKVVGKRKLGFLAVLLAFILPFCLIIVLLVVFNILQFSEIWSGFLALASIIPYYLILSLFKKPLKRKFLFYVQKLN
ncbi:MAG: Fis family transcriptional regulator [Sphingobacteriia bacterium]|jgi:positive regulator of sigma E activity|nr:SoxR reducing system RseC family protein [Paludibacteraceae bacterium]NCA78911.1 Fis family transcriptional regulator [Sphingobacteriia bacterium]